MTTADPATGAGGGPRNSGGSPSSAGGGPSPAATTAPRTGSGSGTAAKFPIAARAWTTKAGRRTADATGGVVRNVRSWDLDHVRRILVTLAVVACTVWLASIAGLFGEFGGQRIPDPTGGVLAPDATLLAPATPASLILLLIYAGLAGYTVHQWLPSQRRSLRHRRLGWTVIAAILLNLAWVLAAQQSLLILSLLILGALLGVLLFALYWLNRYQSATRLEGALVDVPLGLFLGWAILAFPAYTAAVFHALELDWFGLGALTWALIGLAAVTAAGCVICMTDRGRIAVSLAMVWELGWILLERLIGTPASIPVVSAAGLAAFLLLISAGSRRHRVDHSYRRRLRAEQTATLPPIDLGV